MNDSGICLEKSDLSHESLSLAEIADIDFFEESEIFPTDLWVSKQKETSTRDFSEVNPTSSGQLQGITLEDLLCRESFVDLEEHAQPPLGEENVPHTNWDSQGVRRHSGVFGEPNKVGHHDGFLYYQEDIYCHRKTIEGRFHSRLCLQRQPQISVDMRAVLIDWITKLHRECGYEDGTLFLTVNIIDRFLDTTPISRYCFQMLGITSFLIAAKQEEVCPPDIDELLRVCCFAYNRDQVRQLEIIVLNRLHFDLLVPTASFFLAYYSASYHACLTSCTDEDRRSHQACSFARYILELTLQDYDLCQFPSSLLAYTVLDVAVTVLQGPNKPDHKYVNTFTSEQLKQCFDNVWILSDIVLTNCSDLESLCEQYTRKDT